MAELKPVQPTEGLSLSRWSRLKRSGGDVVVASSTEAATATEVVQSKPPAALTDVAEHKLPEISSISLVEDFTPFMQAKVPQALRQQALKALFKEPHFNVMDGLDTYIDDYTVFEPIPPAVMSTLSSWKTIVNPVEQVVTPGGYAVDVASEEGRAVLAAQREFDGLAQVATVPEGPQASAEASEQDFSTSPVAKEAGDDIAGEPAKPVAGCTILPPIQHPRHNQRVSDFAYAVTPDVPPSGAETTE